MAAPALASARAAVWTNVQGLGQLRRLAHQNRQAALPVVARQFEAVFTQMLIKSMRDASVEGGLFDSPQMQQWRGVFDHQIALSLAGDGKGLGIAAMLVRQLGGAATAGKQAPTTPMAMVSPPARSVHEPPPAAVPAAAEGARNAGGIVDRVTQLVEHVGTAALHAASNIVFAGPDDFVQKLAPYARKVARELGVNVRAVLAQAALETGWGQHVPTLPDGRSSHNLFGIKAGRAWAGTPVAASTVEYQGGVAKQVDADFRTYPDPARSFADYARLLTTNPRYASALGRGDNIAGSPAR
jgi:flagellar protein FlgJ